MPVVRMYECGKTWTGSILVPRWAEDSTGISPEIDLSTAQTSPYHAIRRRVELKIFTGFQFSVVKNPAVPSSMEVNLVCPTTLFNSETQSQEQKMNEDSHSESPSGINLFEPSSHPPVPSDVNIHCGTDSGICCYALL
ncbi:hypothetical protein PM082_019254 [Marasmius tenuissimus]|nr:hypothetical protein PM082_019254 [Marasmius tenuissimus]